MDIINDIVWRINFAAICVSTIAATSFYLAIKSIGITRKGLKELKQHKQLIEGSMSAALVGDCYRTALACLLNLEDIEEVPHFYEDAISDRKEDVWGFSEAIEEWIDGWLLERGIVRFRCVLTDEISALRFALEATAILTPKGYPAMLSGSTATGLPHVVIVRDGAVEWDPSKSSGGLVGPMPDGAWVVEWLAYPLAGEFKDGV